MLGTFHSASHTWLHRVPVALKLALLAVLGIALFAVQNPVVLMAVLGACALLFVSLGPATQPVRRLLVSVLVAALLVAGLHVLLHQAELGLVSLARLVSAALLGMAVTVSTSSSDMLNLVEGVLAPLQRFGVRPQRVALRVALMLRFTEHFFVQWQRLDDAYRVRTGRSGGLRLLAPLTILMLLAARRVADTLQVRLGE